MSELLAVGNHLISMKTFKDKQYKHISAAIMVPIIAKEYHVSKSNLTF